MPEKTVSSEEPEKLKQWFEEEIKRRDKIIEDLRKENTVLMKTALRQSEKNLEIRERVKG